MATRPERTVVTYEDYLELPNDRNRYEVLEGELAVAPAPGTTHQRITGRLFYLLYGHVQRNRRGEVLMAPVDVKLSDVSVVQPDLIFVAHDRRAIILPKYVDGPPDLVVEVISPTTARTDRVVKRQLYARYAVPFYWLFDYRRRQAIGFVIENGIYRQAVVAQADQVFAAPPFPDLPILLADLWP